MCVCRREGERERGREREREREGGRGREREGEGGVEVKNILGGGGDLQLSLGLASEKGNERLQ